MKNNMTIRFAVYLSLCAAPLLMAEEADPTAEAVAAEATTTEQAAPAAPVLSEQELHEMLGYMTALGGGVSSLKLDEASVKELATGLHKALSGELSLMTLEQGAVEAAFGEAQARAQAVQAASEELPGFSEGALEKIGVVISMQSGVQQLGFGAAEADAIRDGFISGAAATEMDPGMQAKMPAFQAFIQGRMEIAQAAMLAEQKKASEAAMAEFKETADEWSAKENINVVLETTQGEVEIELYPKEAPLAVANFVGHIEK
ncbi:MAG: peptidylprolyl isomerase, partial [Opitutales bacterium]